MAFSITDDIHSVTDLKRNTREILDQVHTTNRPVVITVNGKPDTVLMDAKIFEEYLRAMNLAELLRPAEISIANKRTIPARKFLREFRRAKKISR